MWIISLVTQFMLTAQVSILVIKFYLNLSTIDKIHSKFNFTDSSVTDGIREPILFSFTLERPAGYKVFCQPETIHYIKNLKNLFRKI